MSSHNTNQVTKVRQFNPIKPLTLNEALQRVSQGSGKSIDDLDLTEEYVACKLGKFELKWRRKATHSRKKWRLRWSTWIIVVIPVLLAAIKILPALFGK